MLVKHLSRTIRAI